MYKEKVVLDGDQASKEQNKENVPPKMTISSLLQQIKDQQPSTPDLGSTISQIPPLLQQQLRPPDQKSPPEKQQQQQQPPPPSQQQQQNEQQRPSTTAEKPVEETMTPSDTLPLIEPKGDISTTEQSKSLPDVQSQQPQTTQVRDQQPKQPQPQQLQEKQQPQPQQQKQLQPQQPSQPQPQPPQPQPQSQQQQSQAKQLWQVLQPQASEPSLQSSAGPSSEKPSTLPSVSKTTTVTAADAKPQPEFNHGVLNVGRYLFSGSVPVCSTIKSWLETPEKSDVSIIEESHVIPSTHTMTVSLSTNNNSTQIYDGIQRRRKTNTSSMHSADTL